MSQYHAARRVCPLEILIGHEAHQHFERPANHIFPPFLESPMTCEYMMVLSLPIYCPLPQFYPNLWSSFRVKIGLKVRAFFTCDSRVQTPFGPLKSGIPVDVDIPAPV